MDYIQPTHVYTRIVESLPWKSGDSSTKGDPRKSVKWIDVSLPTIPSGNLRAP